MPNDAESQPQTHAEIVATLERLRDEAVARAERYDQAIKLLKVVNGTCIAEPVYKTQYDLIVDMVRSKRQTWTADTIIEAFERAGQSMLRASVASALAAGVRKGALKRAAWGVYEAA